MTDGPGFDPFEVLGVGLDADAVVVQLAYRARIREVHPDVAGAAGLEQAKRLNIARDWLLDPALRARIPWSRAGGSPPRGPSGWSAPGWSAPGWSGPGSGPGRARGGGPGEPPGGRPGEARSRWRRHSRAHAANAGPRDAADHPGDFGPRTDELRAFLRSVRDLTRDERARVNYSLGDTRPLSFDTYGVYLWNELRSRSRALRDAVAHAWERGIDEPAPYVYPLGHIMPSGLLVANAYAQWILLGDFFRHELAEAAFRSEHVFEAFAARCRSPWEGSVGQPRHGPYGGRVAALLRAASTLSADTAERLARSWQEQLGRDGRGHPSARVGPGVWLPSPAGYPEVLTVSGYLAAVDASRIDPPRGLARPHHDGFRYGLRLTAHVLALGLGGRAADDYLRPWRDAVGAQPASRYA